jgi:hypothetical protein
VKWPELQTEQVGAIVSHVYNVCNFTSCCHICIYGSKLKLSLFLDYKAKSPYMDTNVGYSGNGIQYTYFESYKIYCTNIGLLSCGAMLTCRKITFQRNMLSPSSGLKMDTASSSLCEST